ncbi:MAG TPA: nickel pincer cofactor biosynthesis protein LarC [Terriglobales bacterium]|nr:nickel pincer cofactor biosynthesis protein LarC [Terriglobales bacterium]
MRIAYLDCFSGISGDMFLGALLDAGVSPALLEKTVAALGVGAHLEIGRVERGGIRATKVDVIVAGARGKPRRQEHGHDRGHHHHEDSPAQPGAAVPHEHGRGLKEIREIIRHAGISAGAKETAIAIFEALGQAEAEIHNVSIEKIHFHEVGAADALADIVGAAVGAEALGVDEWVCSPLNLGGGTVECAHGIFPVPAPATLKLLAGASVYSSGVQAELVTPTGAAIVSVLAGRFAPFPAMKIEKSAYGAGTRDLHGQPNVLRLTVGEAQARAETASDLVAVLEANLDDLNPQLFGYVMERALAEGALDVFGAPVQMKKNRPGMLLTVLCRPEDADRLAKLLFTETTTLGVRRREERRQVLRRESVSVETPWGAVRMKVAHLNGSVANFAPEYEDCRRIAGEHHLPLKTVMQEASRLYLERQHG